MRIPSETREVVFATYQGHPTMEDDDRVLARALTEFGVDVSATPWDLIDPASDFEGRILMLRSTWDYHRRAAEFEGWLRALHRHGAPVVNDCGIALWNMNKRYLAELATRGVPIPRTLVLDAEGLQTWMHAFDHLGCTRAVLKPLIGATAYGTVVVDRATVLKDDSLNLLASSGAMLQEFLPEVQSDGEVSLVFLGGHFSHAARKRPASGDFRVQREFGGTYERTACSARTLAIAQAALSSSGFVPTFARVDLVETHDRGPVLMELELLEPSLFWALAPEGATALAKLVLGR